MHDVRSPDHSILKNAGGRIAFLCLTLATGAAVHALAAAITGVGIAGAMLGTFAAIAAAFILGIRLLDDDAGYALVRKAYQPLALPVGAGIVVLALAVSADVDTVGAAACMMLFGFGMMAALSPISEYVDVDEPSRELARLVRAAAALQGAVLFAAFAAPNPLYASGVAFIAAVAGGLALRRAEPALAVE